MHKILIVDDEADILSTVKQIIESKLSMCEIKTATNGLDAFIECQNAKYDFVITDQKMPFMTGAAFVIALRTKTNQSSEAPVVMLSGYINDTLKSKLKIQNVKFIEKPFIPDDFVDVVRTILV